MTCKERCPILCFVVVLEVPYSVTLYGLRKLATFVDRMNVNN